MVRIYFLKSNLSTSVRRKALNPPPSISNSPISLNILSLHVSLSQLTSSHLQKLNLDNSSPQLEQLTTQLVPNQPTFPSLPLTLLYSPPSLSLSSPLSSSSSPPWPTVSPSLSVSQPWPPPDRSQTEWTPT